MNYKLLSRLSGDTGDYAAAELSRCLRAMDPSLSPGEGGIELALDIIPGDPELDTIAIDVAAGRGVIAATNAGALLIAVYRFLYKLGCRWTHPGEGGELLPPRSFAAEMPTVSVHETPSYRHRGVCIEGALSEENAREMIEFLPRVGMNSYFIQFFRPATFFRRWYEHEQNPTLPKRVLTDAEIDGIKERLVDEIARRGLRYHAIGHGWTCVPFGVAGEGWNVQPDSDFPEEFLAATAEVKGERKAWGGIAINTNLCYSQTSVRERIATAVADYCEKNPAVSALHLWLADDVNNHCECPNCRDTLPSDYYVMLLNEVDALLSERGLDTKIVFLAYLDLLWAPERERIQNPDRFLLMFAPISRTYDRTLREGIEAAGDAELLPYVRNQLPMIRNIGANVAYLAEWQKQFKGSGFVYDYHLMHDHGRDIGYMDCAKTLFKDMQDIHLLGLDGMISCQLSRSAFPTGLPLYGMARALWNKDADFDEMADEYFAAEYGDKGSAVREYLEGITSLFNTDYMREITPRIDARMAERAALVPAYIDAFIAENPEMRTTPTEPWRTLAIHAEYARLFSRIVVERASGRPCADEAEPLREYLCAHEMDIQPRIDLWDMLSSNVKYFVMEPKA